MPNSYISDKNKYLLAVPFMYAFATRYEWPRAFLVNAATAWIPGLILIYSLTQYSLWASIFGYFVGYIAFICVYEIGYMVNDFYSVRYDAIPRRRINLTLDLNIIFTFTASRVVIFSICAALLDLWSYPLFWFSYIALILTLILHNTLRRVEYKFITFLQLSLLRFALPIVPVFLLTNNLKIFSLVAITGMLLFTYPRFLTYLDAKGRFQIPERKEVRFHFTSHLLSLPLLALISTFWVSWAPMLVWGWLILVQLAYILMNEVPRLSALRKRISKSL